MNASRSLRQTRKELLASMSSEGLRLFFPIAALHAALWPFLWVFAFHFSLPLSSTTAAGQWHAQEMIVGSFGAALVGFLTSALPEWTDTARLRGKVLFWLAGLWCLGRISGIAGIETLTLPGAAADQAWLLFLVGYTIFLSWRRRTTSLFGFIVFLCILAGSAAALRVSMASGDYDAGEKAIRIAAFSFLGLLGLALARITVPVTNLLLDSTELTSPYRPHPGRINLAPGLVALLLFAEYFDASEPVRGFLMLATGGAFLDRVAEGFIGRRTFRPEIFCLTLSSGLSGAGLVIGGLSLVGLSFSFIGALHLMLMGGLGIGVLAVLSIAGLLHTGQPLEFPRGARIALAGTVLAVCWRVVPEVLPSILLPGGHGLTAIFWASSLLLWLISYLPLLWSVETLDTESC